MFIYVSIEKESSSFGKYIRMVPYPVMLGFVNGLAIVIFLAQMQQFQVEGADGIMHWLSGVLPG